MAFNSGWDYRDRVRLDGAGMAVAAFYAAALLLRAPALLRDAENLPHESPRRAFCLAAMRPVASFSHALRLDALCAAAEKYERTNLE